MIPLGPSCEGATKRERKQDIWKGETGNHAQYNETEKEGTFCALSQGCDQQNKKRMNSLKYFSHVARRSAWLSPVWLFCQKWQGRIVSYHQQTNVLSVNGSDKRRRVLNESKKCCARFSVFQQVPPPSASTARAPSALGTIHIWSLHWPNGWSLRFFSI